MVGKCTVIVGVVGRYGRHAFIWTFCNQGAMNGSRSSSIARALSSLWGGSGDGGEEEDTSQSQGIFYSLVREYRAAVVIA